MKLFSRQYSSLQNQTLWSSPITIDEKNIDASECGSVRGYIRATYNGVNYRIPFCIDSNSITSSNQNFSQTLEISSSVFITIAITISLTSIKYAIIASSGSWTVAGTAYGKRF